LKIYVRKGTDNQIVNHNFYAAYDGFKQMGFEIRYFHNINELSDHQKEDIVVGYVDDVRDMLHQYGIIAPELDYPEELAEWRCFVRSGDILDVRRYRGNWRSHFDPRIVQNIVNQFKTAPKGYAVDIGLTDKGETLLIEVNDGYALGHYGVFSLDYAKLLSARWSELTNTTDECDF